MVESAFGLLAARFRLLRTTIALSEQTINNCVLAMCALHNWIMPIDPIDSKIESDEPINDNMTLTVERNIEAKNIRESFKKYFNSPAGQVPWQDLAGLAVCQNQLFVTSFNKINS